MGMFDTFKSDNSFRCSNCNKLFKAEQGIQTKKLECELSYYEPGDIVLDLNDNIIVEFDWCPHCQSEIDIFIAFYHGIYIESFDTSIEAQENIDNFDIIEAYKQNNQKYTNIKWKYKKLIADIKSIYDIHTKNYSTNRLSAFLTLKDTDILDYNPIQSIKNILIKFRDI